MSRILLVLLVLTIVAPVVRAANYMELVVQRADYTGQQLDGYEVDIYLKLDSSIGVTGADFEFGQLNLIGDGFTPDPSQPGVLRYNLTFDSFEQMQSLMSAQCRVIIDGTSSSVSAFNLDLSGLTEADLPGTPTDIVPADGSILPSAPSTFTWTAPSNAEGAEVSAYIWGYPQYQHHVLPSGSTSWTHGQTLDLGVDEDSGNYFGLMYLLTEPSSAISVSPLTVTSGSIEWSASPRGASAGWGDGEVMVFRRSLTETSFQVDQVVPEPATLSLLGMGAALLLRRRR